MILVDVGVWLAACWGRHARHAAAARWLDRQEGPLLICRMTQMSLLRLVSNAAVMGDDVLTRAGAWRVVDALRGDARIRWSDEPANLETAFRALSAHDDASHALWTDDYLAAFAQASGATLATLDTKLRKRYPSVTVELVA